MVGVEGFQIKHAINTNELSKGQIEEIKNGYNEGKYERTPRGFENWLKRNGHSERLRNSDSIDVEVRESIIDNARLDSEAPQGESFREPSSSNSQEDRRKSTRLSKTGANGTMFPIIIEVPDIVSLITSLGELYGFRPHLCKPCGNNIFMKNLFSFRNMLYLCQKVGEDAHARQFASTLALLSLNRIFAIK